MNAFFYLTTAAIWGSTWLAIQFQLGEVPVAWSIAYRFGLAALCLLLFCVVTKRSLLFTWQQHLMIMMQAFFLFGMNYYVFYLGSEMLVSGLVGMVYGGLVIMNIINGRLFFGRPVNITVSLGALLGIMGLYLIFNSQLGGFDFTDADTKGFLLCVLGTFLASIGNLLSARNQSRGLPVLQSNAFGMGYGALFIAVFALFSGQAPAWDMSLLYVSSLLYLTLLGTIVAFGCYLTLLGRIGPEKAAYVNVVSPIVALLLSTFFEDFSWTLATFIGLLIVLLGNVLVLRRPAGQKRDEKTAVGAASRP